MIRDRRIGMPYLRLIRDRRIVKPYLRWIRECKEREAT